MIERLVAVAYVALGAISAYGAALLWCFCDKVDSDSAAGPACKIGAGCLFGGLLTLAALFIWRGCGGGS